jgi:hypothetical protein
VGERNPPHKIRERERERERERKRESRVSHTVRMKPFLNKGVAEECIHFGEWRKQISFSNNNIGTALRTRF